MSDNEFEFTEAERNELDHLNEKLMQIEDEQELKRLITKMTLIREKAKQRKSEE